jgi:hypothetical protein
VRSLHRRRLDIERQTLASLIPLTAITIALAEFLFDHKQPRWASPWFWVALVATVALLIIVQILRFGKSKPVPPAKPDYSASTLVRRNSWAQPQRDAESEANLPDPFDRGIR